MSEYDQGFEEGLAAGNQKLAACVKDLDAARAELEKERLECAVWIYTLGWTEYALREKESELAALRSESAKLKKEYLEAGAAVGRETFQENCALHLEIERLRGALEKYGQHPITCARALGGGQFDHSLACTCGFVESLSAPKALCGECGGQRNHPVMGDIQADCLKCNGSGKSPSSEPTDEFKGTTTDNLVFGDPKYGSSEPQERADICKRCADLGIVCLCGE